MSPPELGELAIAVPTLARRFEKLYLAEVVESMVRYGVAASQIYLMKAGGEAAVHRVYDAMVANYTAVQKIPSAPPLRSIQANMPRVRDMEVEAAAQEW
eukprot:SAG11_NODE_25897_length_352_cov_1.209486_1_plen_98_part_01